MASVGNQRLRVPSPPALALAADTAKWPPLFTEPLTRQDVGTPSMPRLHSPPEHHSTYEPRVGTVSTRPRSLSASTARLAVFRPISNSSTRCWPPASLKSTGRARDCCRRQSGHPPAATASKLAVQQPGGRTQHASRAGLPAGGAILPHGPLLSGARASIRAGCFTNSLSPGFPMPSGTDGRGCPGRVTQQAGAEVKRGSPAVPGGLVLAECLSSACEVRGRRLPDACQMPGNCLRVLAA